MPKGKKKSSDDFEVFDPFVGAEEDDLSDMEYVQDENKSSRVETHPPETEEEAKALAEREKEEAKAREKREKEADEAKAKEEEVEKEEEADEPEAKAETDEKVEEAEEEEPEVLEDPTIPKARFDEVNERMKKAENKVKDLEAQVQTLVSKKEETNEPAVPEFDFDAAEERYSEAILDGDTKSAKAIRAEIREAERAQFMAEARKTASEGDAKTRDELELDKAGLELEQKYPELVEGNEEYNSQAYDELMELYAGFARSGKYTRAAALRKAGESIAKIYGLNEPAATAETDESDDRGDNVVTLKKKPANTKKKAQVANDQPPITESTSTENQESTVDVRRMSDSEWEKLPESTKARLRGDVV